MKILVRLPNWLGDVVMSTAFITAVKQLYPGATIDVIIKKELTSIAPLIEGLNTIHIFSKTDFKGLNGVYRFGKTLKAEKYDLFFCLPESISSAMMGWATDAKERIGFGKEGRFFLLSNTIKKPLNIHRVDEYISILEQFANKRITNRHTTLTIKHTETSKNSVLVNFNSEADSRRMPVDKARHIINTLTNTFVSTNFVLIGSAKESEYVNQVIFNADNIGQIDNYVGKTDLIGLCELMRTATAVLTTDSGPAHLANSIGTPTIALFGAGDENNTAPYNKHNLIIIRSGKLPCEPCVRNTCKLYGIPKCMILIEETEIVNALSLYLKND